jgi:hypothetical protein
MPRRGTFRPGDRIALRVDAERALLFDPDLLDPLDSKGGSS